MGHPQIEFYTLSIDGNENCHTYYDQQRDTVSPRVQPHFTVREKGNANLFTHYFYFHHFFIVYQIQSPFIVFTGRFQLQFIVVCIIITTTALEKMTI